MKNNSLKILAKDLHKFKDILRKQGYAWDINNLNSLFVNNETFNSLEIRNYWKKFLKHHKKNKVIINNIDCYINIPFCSSKCAYCLFPSWICTDEKQLKDYVGNLIEYMQFFSNTFKDIRFRNLYIGGGTPNILSKNLLNKLLSALFNNFSFNKSGQKTCEINPHNIDPSKFTILREFGLNRVSVGVQTLNTKALKINKRDYQTSENITNTVILAKKAGFKDINTDLIAGLVGDSLMNFKNNLESIMKLEPYNIVIYGLMIPNDSYLTNNLKIDREQYFIKDYPKMIRGALKIVKTLSSKFNYIPDSLDSTRWYWGLRHADHLDRNASKTYSGEYSACIFGIGTFSKSTLPELMEYRQTKHITKFDPNATIYRGRKLLKKEALIKFIIRCLDRESIIPLKQFRKIFKVSLSEKFPYALYALKKFKKITLSKDFLYFKSKMPWDKYIYTLFFFAKNNDA
ncbi:radical SAM protein [Thermoproteota archaeon]